MMLIQKLGKTSLIKFLLESLLKASVKNLVKAPFDVVLVGQFIVSILKIKMFHFCKSFMLGIPRNVQLLPIFSIIIADFKTELLSPEGSTTT